MQVLWRLRSLCNCYVQCTRFIQFFSFSPIVQLTKHLSKKLLSRQKLHKTVVKVIPVSELNFTWTKMRLRLNLHTFLKALHSDFLHCHFHCFCAGQQDLSSHGEIAAASAPPSLLNLHWIRHSSKCKINKGVNISYLQCANSICQFGLRIKFGLSEFISAWLANGLDLSWASSQIYWHPCEHVTLSTLSEPNTIFCDDSCGSSFL